MNPESPQNPLEAPESDANVRDGSGQPTIEQRLQKLEWFVPRRVHTKDPATMYYPAYSGTVRLSWHANIHRTPNLDQLADLLTEQFPDVKWTIEVPGGPLGGVF